MTDHLTDTDRKLCEALLAEPPPGIIGLGGAPGTTAVRHAWLAGNLSLHGPRAATRIRTLSTDLARIEAVAAKLAEALGEAIEFGGDEKQAREALSAYQQR